jgi:predicted transcriptional regulator
MARPTIGTDVFGAVAHHRRRRILERLQRARELTPGALIAELNMNKTVMSHHLRVLQTAGLISHRIAGRNLVYRINPGRLAVVAQWLRRVEQPPTRVSSAPAAR